MLLQVRTERYVGSTFVRKSFCARVLRVEDSHVLCVYRYNYRAKACGLSWEGWRLGVLGWKGSQNCAYFQALQTRGEVPLWRIC